MHGTAPDLSALLGVQRKHYPAPAPSGCTREARPRPGHHSADGTGSSRGEPILPRRAHTARPAREESPPGQAHRVGALGTRKASSAGTPVRRAWAEGPLGKYTGKARKRQGLPGQHGTRPARCLEARAVNDGEPQSGSGYPKGVRSQWRTRPRLPRACTPEPIRLQRHAPNTPATAAEAADRGAAMFTAAPIRRTIAARPNPAQLQAEHDHTTQASSCPAIAAGSNPAPVRARPQPRNPRRTPAPSPPPARTPAHANPARAVQRVQC
jgi:hypothetical protein